MPWSGGILTAQSQSSASSLSQYSSGEAITLDHALFSRKLKLHYDYGIIGIDSCPCSIAPALVLRVRIHEPSWWLHSTPFISAL